MAVVALVSFSAVRRSYSELVTNVSPFFFFLPSLGTALARFVAKMAAWHNMKQQSVLGAVCRNWSGTSSATGAGLRLKLCHDYIGKSVPICNELQYASKSSWRYLHWLLSSALICEHMRKTSMNNTRSSEVTLWASQSSLNNCGDASEQMSLPGSIQAQCY